MIFNDSKHTSAFKQFFASAITCGLLSAIILGASYGTSGAPYAATSPAAPQSQAVDTLHEDKLQPELSDASIYSSVAEEDYVSNTVLINLDNDYDLQAIQNKLASIAEITNLQIDTSSTDAGFVTVTYDGPNNAGDISDRLQAMGLTAQPNFIYYALDQDNSNNNTQANTAEATPNTADANADNATTTDNSQGSLPAGDSLVDMPDAGNLDGSLIAQGLSTNDPKRQDQWWLEAIKAPDAWNFIKSKLGSTSKHPVAVAVIDSGCDVNHPDLKGNIVGTYDAKSGSSDVTDTDIGSHGTSVAGIIAAEANNSIGLAGVSYNAGLYIVRAAYSDKGVLTIDSANIRKAYANITANKNLGGNKGTIRVINLSYGRRATGSLGAPDNAVMAAIEVAYENHNILTVSAAGNDDGNLPYKCFPCDFSDNMIGVIGLEQSSSAYTRYISSNYNVSGADTKQLSAPGVNIYTTSTNSYRTQTGTSFATPQVTGVAALVLAANPNLSAGEVKSILCETATDLGAAGFDAQTGYGVVNAFKAVQYATCNVMHRLYNPNSGEHLFTADTNEKNTLSKIGWKYEGTGWIAPKLSSTPVYRLYNPYSGDHHYTTDKNEYNQLGKIGWRQEKVSFYSSDSKEIATYRLFNPDVKVGTHHYTTDKNEYDRLCKIGWRGEGLAWYGMKS